MYLISLLHRCCHLPGNVYIYRFYSSRKQENLKNLHIGANQLLALLIFFFSISSTGFAQQNVNTVDAAAAYTVSINERAGKIVTTLKITDPDKTVRVRNIIAEQYRNLNEIHTNRDTEMKAAKSRSIASDAATLTAKLSSIEEDTKSRLSNLHSDYLRKLSIELTPSQVEQVKDGMTYGVVQVTYKGYQEMIPTLNEEQKKQIYSWLIEARELAMDAESSDKKHATFGKYKGRINNYLSAAGYDLKKASEDWHNRIKAEEAAKKGQ